jgi:FkbM family methyltransferase
MGAIRSMKKGKARPGLSRMAGVVILALSLAGFVLVANIGQESNNHVSLLKMEEAILAQINVDSSARDANSSPFTASEKTQSILPPSDGDPRRKDLLKNSVKVPPIKSYIDGKEVVPAHALTILDDAGECILPGEKFCDDYRNARQDPHVDQAIMTVLRGRCTPTTRVWDFGGNIGYYSLFMRAMGCHVTVVEPQPSMNTIHKESREANGWDKDGSVIIHEKGVSDMPGKIKLEKLWQPGNKNAGSMEIETITIAQLAEETPGGVVELLKLDIDGPEIYTLRGIIDLKDSLLVKNIIAELTVGVWEKIFKVDDKTVLEIFHRYYDAGYIMFLVAESEFPGYNKETLGKLREVRNFKELVHSYEIPKDLIGDVLNMNRKVTKNIFMTKDPAIVPKL